MNFKKLLIIDEEEDVIKIVEYCLWVENGWTVINAISVNEGITKAIVSQPDYILLDMIRSEKYIEILKLLSENKITNNIPIVIFTAKIIEKVQEKKRKFREFKVKGIINKPFNPINLGNEIKQVVGNRLSFFPSAPGGLGEGFPQIAN